MNLTNHPAQFSTVPEPYVQASFVTQLSWVVVRRPSFMQACAPGAHHPTSAAAKCSNHSEPSRPRMTGMDLLTCVNDLQRTSCP